MSELIADKIDPWTFEELRALPESQWRYEIVDGSLVMSPSPGLRHEAVSGLLRAALNADQTPDRFALGPISVDLHPSYRIPDLVVIDRSMLAADVRLLRVADVRLVIEVVSPGSSTTDRITKPAEYAAAGIPAYWRVETAGPVSVTAYVALGHDRVYTELGTWREGETMRLDEPFAVSLDISDCAP